MSDQTRFLTEITYTPVYLVSSEYLTNYTFVGTQTEVAHLLVDPDRRFLKHSMYPIVKVLDVASGRFRKLTLDERRTFYSNWGSFHGPGILDAEARLKDAQLKERLGLLR